MSHQSTTRVPVDDAYAALVGKAVYIFSYYEWTIIWIIESLQNGFVEKYSREQTMTSGAVLKALQKLIDDPAMAHPKATKAQIQACCDEFDELVVKRNALIHAHPCTDSDGSQILIYQTQITKPLPDMMWPKCEVEALISEFDEAACNAGRLLDTLR